MKGLTFDSKKIGGYFEGDFTASKIKLACIFLIQFLYKM